jgi:hypothetical protein
VATPSQGITVTFDGVPFTEVTDLQWTYAGGSSKGRSVAWTDDAGSVTLACLGTANTSTTNYGKRASLDVTGGGMDLTFMAVYEQVTAAAELNGATRYGVTFKLLDDG